MATHLKKLVILGTGWGSYSCFQTVNRQLYRVIVVSPRNHFLFTPLLCSTTVGTLEFRSIIEPIRNTRFREPDDFHLASVSKWDPVVKKITCNSQLDTANFYDLSYDKLVVGVGALPNTFNVPGVLEHACFLKEITDARRIRNRILNNFELSLEPGIDNVTRAKLLHIVIVGGGPTGVEFGAELYDFIEQDVARLYGQQQKNIRVTLIESNKILASFDARLQAYAQTKIESRENFHLVKSAVSRVESDAVVLSDGSRIPCGLVVWSTGLSPRSFIASLNDVEKNKQGQIVTDNFLKIVSDPSGCSYAIGDCADINSMPLPCTAQVAEREGRYVGKSLNTIGKSGESNVEPFKYTSMGMLTYLGDYRGLSDTPNVKLKGVTSWLLWRSAYLTRLGSWRLRMQVPLDWLKTIIFGRDTSRF